MQCVHVCVSVSAKFCCEPKIALKIKSIKNNTHSLVKLVKIVRTRGR